MRRHPTRLRRAARRGSCRPARRERGARHHPSRRHHPGDHQSRRSLPLAYIPVRWCLGRARPLRRACRSVPDARDRRPDRHRRRRLVAHRAAAVPREGHPGRRRSEDHRQRRRRHGGDLRVRHRGPDRHRCDRQGPFDGREPRARHGGRGDGPVCRVDRAALRDSRLGRRDSDPRDPLRSREGVREDPPARGRGPPFQHRGGGGRGGAQGWDRIAHRPGARASGRRRRQGRELDRGNDGQGDAHSGARPPAAGRQSHDVRPPARAAVRRRRGAPHRREQVREHGRPPAPDDRLRGHRRGARHPQTRAARLRHHRHRAGSRHQPGRLTGAPAAAARPPRPFALAAPVTLYSAVRISRDHFLPPDPQAFLAAEPATGRVIVIAPTRAACETIELAMTLDIETLLEREHGADIRRLAASGRGFGIVAGTGTGKTLAIRPIAATILGAPLKVGVVNREREATPETPTWNVVIVTTGIARRWFEDGLITDRDTLVVDEIHQTSAELELCLALGKRARCRFRWLSATVDPSFYARYLASIEVLETHAFDPATAADVHVLPEQALEFLIEPFVRRVIRERRGVAVFVPTREEVEQIAKALGDRWQALATAFYHGGEPIRVIRPFLDGQVKRPFLLAMTAAGQSALNIRGLDTVVIYDARYTNVVERGRNVLTRLYLGANEILQMAGRVHGRVEGGEVYILSDRELVM